MGNTNSIGRYTNNNLQELAESLGRTQFSTVDVNLWYQIIGGLQIQGGLAAGAGAILFQAPYEKQVLGIFTNGPVATAITLNGFTAGGAGHWFAIGI